MTPDDILSFWFAGDTRARWFDVSPQFDAEIRRRFGALYEDAASLPWRNDATSALALVILLDQFPRNMFRDSPRAFESDGQALAVANDAIARGFDTVLIAEQRRFLYMPFMHAESLAAQDRGIELFTALGDADTLDYMKRHRDIIARFGRFPHRNAILDRTSTPDELASGATKQGF